MPVLYEFSWFSVGGNPLDILLNIFWIVLAGGIAFGMPNTVSLFYPLFEKKEVRVDYLSQNASFFSDLGWKINIKWSLMVGALAGAIAISLANPTEFLYFQF